MGYPSLTNINDNLINKVDIDLFDDLKINLFLDEDTIDFMSKICDREDILYRQQLFSILLKQELNSNSSIEKLYVSIQTIFDLYERFKKSTSINEKTIVYFNICSETINFFNIASNIEYDSYFTNRFKEYFVSRINHGNFIKISETINEFKEDINKITSVKISIDDDNVKLSNQFDDSYISKLTKAANELNISLDLHTNKLNNNLDNSIIDGIAQLYPDSFDKFKDFYDKNKNFFEEDILRYKSEIKFYIDICNLTKNYVSLKIPYTFPVISNEKKIQLSNAYDISLIKKESKEIIPNDSFLNTENQIYFLIGANGGGKTTYLRTIGISVMLFLSGAPIPCDYAEISVLDNIFTHFPKDERFNNVGRNEEEVIRINSIIENVTSDSLVLLNETFSTTNEEKSAEQTLNLAKTLKEKNVFAIYVTHQMPENDIGIPYLFVIIDENNNNTRTYKVARVDSKRGSFAYDVLNKYGLTREQLKERLSRGTV